MPPAEGAGKCAGKLKKAAIPVTSGVKFYGSQNILDTYDANDRGGKKDLKKEELLERSETFLRGFFEKGLPVEDLLAGADPVDFSWIGPGEKEFFDNREALLAWYRRAAVQKARKTGPVTALEMQCVFPEEDAAEVTARFWVSEERSRLEYRATLIYTRK